MKKLWSAFILAFLVSASGCATLAQPRFEIYVDSLSATTPTANKHYILLSGNEDTSVNDLQFKEYAAYVNRALVSRGFVPAESIEVADLGIFLTYGIGNPEKHLYSRSIPVFGQTGVSSSTTYGTLNTYGNSSTYSGTTTYSPTYGIKGYTSGVASYTMYSRFLVLDALDLSKYRETKKEIQLWKTTLTSSGSSGDLRRVPELVKHIETAPFGN